MSYRVFAGAYGLCSRHPQTPAIGCCDAGCGARLCEHCVNFTLLAIRCVRCENVQLVRRVRRRRRLAIGALLAIALATPVINYIAWHFPHGAHCMNEPSDVCCSHAIFERCWDGRLYLNQSG
jgi:hypothetical protein